MSKPVILCVDDEQMVLSSLKQQLKSQFAGNYQIETAESGEEALELVLEMVANNVDIPVIISDQIMPGMKGDELLQQVHALSPRTLTVLLTGQASMAAISNAVNQARLYRYIAKPWDQQDLWMTIGEAAHSYFQDKKIGEQNILLQQMNLNLEEMNQELEKKLRTLHRFVPHQFLNVLNVQEYDEIERGRSVERMMSVMFADIRGFTMMSEQLQPREIFAFINSYYGHLGPAIHMHGGFIDKYIGDAIMALFEDADKAVESALAMIKALEEYNQGRERAGYQPIAIGIGINSGMLIMGTVGEEDRLQTTVMGDIVNLASHAESLTKHYGVQIIITDHTLNTLQNPDKHSLRRLDEVRMKGKQQAVTLFAVTPPGRVAADGGDI
jgi:class 3 adenylate cyclase